MSVMSSSLSFAEEFQAPGQLVIQPERFAAAMHLQLRELARLAHVHKATVLEAPGNLRLQTYMREALKVISAALNVTQGTDRAIYWFRNAPIPQFGHQTPEQLVAAHHTDAVLSYLNSIAGGSAR